MKRYLVIGIALISLGWFMAHQAAAADVGGIIGHAARGDVGGAIAHGLGGHQGNWGSGHWGGGGYGGHHWGNYNPYYSRNYYSPHLGYSYYYPYYSSYNYYPYYNYTNPYSSGYGYPSAGYGAGYPADSGAYTSAYWPQGAQGATTGMPATGPVRILNPASNEATLSFTVNGQRFTVPPGHQQDLPAGAGQVVEFHRGGDRGTARYSLQGGLYTFTPTDQGWELYHTSTTLPGQEGGIQGQPSDFQGQPGTPGQPGTFPGQQGEFRQPQGTFGQPQNFGQPQTFGQPGGFQGQPGGFQGQQGGFQGQSQSFQNPPATQQR